MYLFQKHYSLQNDLQQITAKQRLSLYPGITHTSGSVNGAPKLCGRLLSVKDVVQAMYTCPDPKEVADEYQISIAQILQALLYCSGQHCKQDKPESFCDTCSLRKEQKGPLDMSSYEEVTFNNTTYVRGEDSLFLGTMNELLEDWNGKDWWNIATDLLIDFRQDLFR